MITWAYVAGFFDGEGSVGGCGTSRGQKGGCRVFCRIAQQHTGVLETVRDFLALHGIKSGIVGPHRTGFAGNPQFALNIPIRGICAFLAGVRPYVIVKKQKVEDIWRYLTLYPALTHQQVGWMRNEMRWVGHVKQTPEQLRAAEHRRYLARKARAAA